MKLTTENFRHWLEHRWRIIPLHDLRERCNFEFEVFLYVCSESANTTNIHRARLTVLTFGPRRSEGASGSQQSSGLTQFRPFYVPPVDFRASGASVKKQKNSGLKQWRANQWIFSFYLRTRNQKLQWISAEKSKKAHMVRSAGTTNAMNATWTNTSRGILLSAIKVQTLAGKGTDNGLKSEAWKEVMKAFNSALNLE